MTYPITTPVIIALILALICLVLSGFFSGSEVAFFSLRPKDIEQLEESSEKREKQVLEALANSDYLLGTILVMTDSDLQRGPTIGASNHCRHGYINGYIFSNNLTL